MATKLPVTPTLLHEAGHTIEVNGCDGDHTSAEVTGLTKLMARAPAEEMTPEELQALVFWAEHHPAVDDDWVVFDFNPQRSRAMWKAADRLAAAIKDYTKGAPA